MKRVSFVAFLFSSNIIMSTREEKTKKKNVSFAVWILSLVDNLGGLLQLLPLVHRFFKHSGITSRQLACVSSERKSNFEGQLWVEKLSMKIPWNSQELNVSR